MARKNLLQGLMDSAKDQEQAEPETDHPLAPRYTKGAIGAVSKSIADLKSRSVIELDPFSIRAGGLADRLEHDDRDHAVLMESIRQYGQQVPVLVRADPDEEGHFRIVYGRRRVLALRDLGLPVKAMIRNLDEQEAILAQGQENAARRDLSFVERCNFARQMVEAGYDRKIIADALATDKTLISRMLTVAETVPLQLIEQIGSASGIGRDRWLAFARLWAARQPDTTDALAMLADAHNTTSNGRFETLFKWLERRATARVKSVPPPKPVAALIAQDGTRIGKLSRTGSALRIELIEKHAGGFDHWLEENLGEIHRDWLKSRGE